LCCWFPGFDEPIEVRPRRADAGKAVIEIEVVPADACGKEISFLPVRFSYSDCRKFNQSIYKLT